MTTPALLIEDFSALGQISMTGALSVLQAMDITTASLPATVLSSQTEGFGIPESLSTNEWLTQALQHWQTINIKFSGILIGYLGQAKLVQLLLSKLDFTNSLVVIDPVMADQGSLYPGLTLDYVGVIKKLCRHAQIITPNWTELCLLTDQPFQKPTRPLIIDHIHQLRKQGVTAQVIVTGIEQADQIGCGWLENDQWRFCGNHKQPGHFYGTGDVFVALIYGKLLKGACLSNAIKIATQAMEKAILQTAPLSDTERRYGLKLGQLINYISQDIREN